MLKLTENAIKQVHEAAKQSNVEGMALRIAAKHKEDGSIEYAMGFDAPKDEDVRSTQGDIDLVVDPGSAPLLDECIMDFVELDDGDQEFVFLNPNDPHYVPPKKEKKQ